MIGFGVFIGKKLLAWFSDKGQAETFSHSLNYKATIKEISIGIIVDAI